VVIDGKPAVAAPVEKLQMNAGKHKVEAQADCYLPVSTQLNVLAGEEAKWTPEMTLAEGGVDVSVADTDGKKVKGDLWIDGQKIGPVPGKYKAGVCAKEMVVKTSWDATYSAPLAIKAKKIVSMKAVVDPEPVKEVAAEAPPPPPEEPSEKKDVGARHAVPETTPVSSSERSKYINAGHAAFWTGLAVAGIGGGISTWQMTVNKDKANNATTSSDLSMYTGKYNLCLGFSIAMYLIGAGAMITGIALWGIAPEIKTNAGVVSGLNLSPVIGPGSAGLSAGGQW
jgi:hypothetical protein